MTSEPSTPQRQRYPKWLWIVPTVLLLLGTSYLLSGYYLVPRLIRWQATEWVHDKLHKSLTLGQIRFDSLRFAVDMNDIAVSDQTGSLVSVGHLRLGFSPLSIFQSAYRLTELRLDRPVVNAVIKQDGSLNLAGLIPPSEPSQPNSGQSAAIKIDELAVSDGRVAFADYSRALQPKTLLSPVNFTLRDFQTAGAGKGEFSLKAASQKGERFAWQGLVSMAPISSRGHIDIANLQSDTVYHFLGDYMPVTLTSGHASISADYNFAYDRAGLRLTASLPQFALDDIGVQGEKVFSGLAHVDGLVLTGGRINMSGSSGIPEAITADIQQVSFHGASLAGPALARDHPVQLASGSLEHIALDYAAHKVTLGTLSLAGLNLPVRREANGAIDLMGLVPVNTDAPKPSAPEPAWDIQLDQAALTASAVHLEDHTVTPSARFDLDNIAITANGLSMDMAKPVNLRLSARLNGGASLAGQGTVTPATSAGVMHVAMAALPLKALLPYIPALPGLDIRSGTLGAKGTLTLPGKQGSLRFDGDASLGNFAAYQSESGTSLIAWGNLALSGIRYRPEAVDIATARLLSPSGSIAIMADRSFNFSTLITTPSQSASQPAAVPTAAATPGIKPAATAAATTTASATTSLPVHLRTLMIEGGVLNFADYSITPNFEARIEALHGTIRNITTEPGTVATIDLQGQVIDRLSPVTVNGTVDLFQFDRESNIAIAFRNIELPIFNPYSGTYAGYSIAKGKLSTEFKYRITNRVLDSEHHIEINQLEWGQESATKAKVPLPVRFATSLLKDKNGNINLDVPVKGSLDEPTFRLGPIIWKIIGNLIEKAATAPFRLLGSAFNGAEKAQYVDFAPGSATLPAGVGDNLAALAKALGDRPALNLDVPVGPGLTADAVAIADTRIDAATMSKGNKGGKQPTEFSALTPEEQRDRLHSLYKLRFHTSAKIPDKQADRSASNGKEQRRTEEIQWLRAELRKSFTPDQKELEALGAARGKAIRDALLAKGDIDPLRVFLSTSAPVSEQDGLIRYELKLK